MPERPVRFSEEAPSSKRGKARLLKEFIGLFDLQLYQVIFLILGGSEEILLDFTIRNAERQANKLKSKL